MNSSIKLVVLLEHLREKASEQHQNRPVEQLKIVRINLSTVQYNKPSRPN